MTIMVDDRHTRVPPRFMPDELSRPVDEVAGTLDVARERVSQGRGDTYTSGVARAGEWLARIDPWSPLTRKTGQPLRFAVDEEIRTGHRILDHTRWQPETVEDFTREAASFDDVPRSDDPPEFVQGVVDMLTWATTTDTDTEAPLRPQPGDAGVALAFMPDELARPVRQLVDVLATADTMRQQRQQPDRVRGVLAAGQWLGQATARAPLSGEPLRPLRRVIVDEIGTGLRIEDGHEPLWDPDAPLDYVRGAVDLLTWVISTDAGELPLWPDGQPGPSLVFQPGTLARPAADLAAVHTAAVAQQRGAPGTEYLVGVVWACEWLGGVRDRCLPGTQPRPATPDAVAAELELARAAWFRRANVPTLSRPLVRGAGSTLRYATDPDADPPVQL